MCIALQTERQPEWDKGAGTVFSNMWEENSAAHYWDNTLLACKINASHNENTMMQQ